jgi:hypothetical protein
MNEQDRARSFDDLARGLAKNDISRRQAVKWAGYSVLGAALSSVGFADTAEALTRRQRRRCRRRGGRPCGGQCVHTATDPNNCGGCNIFCDLAQSCVNGTCVDDVPACTASCCCSCTWMDNAGTEISQCHSAFTGPSCDDYCRTSEKSGGGLPSNTTFVRANGVCSAPGDTTVHICLRGECVQRACEQAPA